MKTWLVVLVGALSCSPALAGDGKAVFEANGCTACHSADKEMVGPPLKEIATVYGANRDALLAFLSGKGDP
ncbi:MAG: c-type cytochrome, partial [Proteobacteria bacterium]|nr:c-type cytochrome [Pseudomonadota bacterium]